MSGARVAGAACIGLGTGILIYYIALRKKKKPKISVPKMTLYWYDSFRSRRCEWLIAELGVQDDVKMECMNPMDTDQEKIAQYRQISPHGTIPALEVEGHSLIFESGAVCLYLAHLYNRLLPDDQNTYAYFNWLVYAVSTLDEMMETLFRQWTFTKPENQDSDAIDKATQKFAVFARCLSKHLEDKEYICGNRLTAVDCVLGYNLWWASLMRDGVLLHGYPVIQRYFNSLQRRSAYQRVFIEDKPVQSAEVTS